MGEAGTLKLYIGAWEMMGTIVVDGSVPMNTSGLKYDGELISERCAALLTKHVVQLPNGLLVRTIDGNYKTYGVLVTSADGSVNHRYLEVGERDLPPRPGRAYEEYIHGLGVNWTTGDLVVYLSSDKGYNKDDKILQVMRNEIDGLNTRSKRSFASRLSQRAVWSEILMRGPFQEQPWER